MWPSESLEVAALGHAHVEVAVGAEDHPVLRARRDAVAVVRCENDEERDEEKTKDRDLVGKGHARPYMPKRPWSGE